MASSDSTIKPIIFFDIPDSKQNGWSPNTWKVRYALNIKGLPYKTVWVEYPDIAAVSREIGAKPTSPGGAIEYTLPAIKDPNNDVVISDSIDIIRYLDETYPNTPQLFNSSIFGLQLATSHALDSILAQDIRPLIVLSIHNNLDSRAQAYFRETRERRFGKSLEDVCPPGEAQSKQWKRLEESFGKVAQWFDGQSGSFFVGDQVSFLDVQLAGFFRWIQPFVPKERWDAILQWHNGRWEKFIGTFEKWGFMDKGLAYDSWKKS